MTFAQNPRDVANQNKLSRRVQAWSTALLPRAIEGAHVTVLTEDDETFIVVLPPVGSSSETKRLRIAMPVRIITKDDVAAAMNEAYPVLPLHQQEASAASKEPVKAPGAPAVERAEAPAVAGAPAATADDPGKCSVS